MDVATIEENRWEARQKYAEYLKAVKERHSSEYEALKNAYREISKGNQVIDLVESFRKSGLDSLGRPLLAVARADAQRCWFRWDSWKPTFQDRSFWGRKPPKSARFELPQKTFSHSNHTPPAKPHSQTLQAIVPTIPPSLLPSGKLDRYVILWEADWEVVPVDPMLLAPLGKNLYRVLATWDLTPLERAVLSDRLG